MVQDQKMTNNNAQYTTAETDWQAHRERIKQLYLDLDWTLKDVKSHMEHVHDLKAT